MRGAPDRIDWEAIERSPEFRALVASRRRFVVAAGGGVVGLTAVFVIVAYLAPDVLAATVVEPITFGFVAGVGLIVLTWIVTLAYLRRSDRDWAPQERRLAARATPAGGRFVREDREPVHTESPAGATRSDRSPGDGPR
jgi:uncharacterized membrane protein (DUF485 family)